MRVFQNKNQQLGRLLIPVLCIILLLGITVAGCGTASRKPIPQKTLVNPGAAANREAAVTERLRLYFADQQKQYLIPESRVVTTQPSNLPARVVKELIRGPQVSGTVSTIPAETRLRSVSVSSMTARVDLSKEIVTQHQGGAAAEKLTVYSIVDSLARVTGITRVQILIEGQVPKSPLGGIDLSQPLLPDYSLIKSATTTKVIIRHVPVPVKEPVKAPMTNSERTETNQKERQGITTAPDKSSNSGNNTMQSQQVPNESSGKNNSAPQNERNDARDDSETRGTMLLSPPD